MLELIANFWPFILLAIPVAIYAIYKARIKGAIGEKTVAWKLSRLPKSRYKVINNLCDQIVLLFKTSNKLFKNKEL